jgi:hypothetical protein
MFLGSRGKLKFAFVTLLLWFSYSFLCGAGNIRFSLSHDYRYPFYLKLLEFVWD